MLGADQRLDVAAVRRAGQQRHPPAQHVDLAAVGLARDPVGQAHELRDEGRPGAVVELGRRGDLLQAPGGHDAHAVAHREGLLLVVGHEQGGDAHHDLDPPDLLAELAAHLGVQRGERLVEQQDAGLDRECPSERHALLLAARHLVRVLVRLVAQAHHVERLLGLALAGGAVHAAQTQAVGHVVARGHVGEQAVRLEHDAHVPLVGGHPGDVPAAHQDPALVHLVQAAERPQGGGLAAAGRAEQRDELARGDVDGQALERVHRAVPAVHVLEDDGDAVPGGGRAGAGGGHQAGSSAARWARWSAPGAKREMTNSRANANSRASRDTATETNGSRLPSR